MARRKMKMKRMEQLEQRERELFKISFANERKLTAEETLELEEIRCISMIHSCEIYAKEVEFFNEHATVTKDVFTDSEGCSYNSVSYDI